MLVLRNANNEAAAFIANTQKKGNPDKQTAININQWFLRCFELKLSQLYIYIGHYEPYKQPHGKHVK
jgi:hypothetical protein